jgi:hypothetical protein
LPDDRKSTLTFTRSIRSVRTAMLPVSTAW